MHKLAQCSIAMSTTRATLGSGGKPRGISEIDILTLHVQLPHTAKLVGSTLAAVVCSRFGFDPYPILVYSSVPLFVV